MPIKDSIGYGELTPTKIEILKEIFDMHLAVTQAVLRKRSAYKQIYTYIDATSGKGIVPGSNIFGSPLVFLNSVHSQTIDMPYIAHFIECEEVNYLELKKNVFYYSNQQNWHLQNNVQYYHGEYEQKIIDILKKPDDRELGLMFIDHSGDLPNFDTIGHFSKIRPRMEILIYLSTTNIKRLHHNTNKSLLDYMQQISKEFWLIRKPLKWDRHQWTFLLGTNTDIFKRYKKINFYRLDSEEAQAFFPKLNLTSKERLEKLQPRLPSL